MIASDGTIGIVCGMRGGEYKDGLYLHLSLGRVIDSLARRYKKVCLCMPISKGPPDSSLDHVVQAKNLDLIPQPFYTGSLNALKCMLEITRSYAEVCRKADVLFIRGMAPFVAVLYINAWRHKCRVCHWIVGNPVALLKSHRRAGRIMDALSIAYAWQDRLFTKLGRWLVGGAFVCNGRELGRIYKSPRTITTVSSIIKEDEFFRRQDTCQNRKIKILFIGFIRPEKGVEYLIEALGRLEIKRDWELIMVGTFGKYHAYKTRLDLLINRYGLADKVNWVGYAAYGQPMFEYLRKADLLVLPTLSEGTPRVLVEARANSLPVVSTNVGGVPTSVQDGYDGLLVPPKDSDALARAIKRLVEDGELRRSIIANGLERTRKMTIGHFVDLVFDVMENPKRKQ